MKLIENQITTIIYNNESKKETTSRVIIPTSIPKDTIRAIDVDELSSDERQEMQKLYTEYRDYTTAFVSNMFNFEDWVEHSTGKKVQPKWRAFKQSGLLS